MIISYKAKKKEINKVHQRMIKTKIQISDSYAIQMGTAATHTNGPRERTREPSHCTDSPRLWYQSVTWSFSLVKSYGYRKKLRVTLKSYG